MHTPFEVIETDALEVYCDGGKGPLGHPRVFLHIDPDSGEVTCPYCSRNFVLSSLSRERERVAR